jgi:ArsR family transcriptional regulator, arsenate/arsenite/antimonite-responsive transcriptional repressor
MDLAAAWEQFLLGWRKTMALEAQADPAVTLSEDQVQLIAKALADPRRYEILRRIGASDDATPCSCMRDCIDISPATLSHHMKELETAGLVTVTRNGKFVNYALRREVLDAFRKRLGDDFA